MPVPRGDRPFDALAAEFVADELETAPTLATALGLTDHDDRLPDMSRAAIAACEARDDAWLARLTQLDETGLRRAERIDRDLVVMRLRARASMRAWCDWRRSPDHYAGAALQGVWLLLLHRLAPEPQLSRSVAARLRATPRLLQQGIENLDPTLASPALLRRSLGQIGAGAAYARAVAAQVHPELHDEVAAAGEEAAAAYERFGAHVADLADRATGSWAIGEGHYDALLRVGEGLSYGAREMRERGQAAYDEIVTDMRRRSLALRGDEDWRAAVEALNDDAPGSPEEMLELYRVATARAREFCVERELVTMPEGEDCAVVPSAPFTRGMLAVAHYMAPPPFADLTDSTTGRGLASGHFFVPYPPDGASEQMVRERLATNSRATIWPIAVHEAYPGHHWHFSWVAANRPVRPLRVVLGSAYFVEGWGLYTEELMREEGFYTTPEQELTQRDMRLFRAARIIVDTSLHLGEMTVDEAVTFMSTKASLTEETARAEVLRYCAWPTQAASYLTGALEIARMRERWFYEARGPLQEFHDRAAASGRLPVSLVERVLFEEPPPGAPPLPEE